MGINEQHAQVFLRPANLGDPTEQEFMFKVYASTRQEELAILPWDPAQKEAFLRMQFEAQRRSYLNQFPGARYEVIEWGSAPVGRLITDISPRDILLIDIALLPEGRGMGIGARLLRDLQSAAAAERKPLRLHVEFYNPARRLYDRLGFKEKGGDGIYLEMEWTAEEE